MCVSVYDIYVRMINYEPQSRAIMARVIALRARDTDRKKYIALSATFAERAKLNSAIFII